MFIQVNIVGLIRGISNFRLKWKSQVYCWCFIFIFFNLELTSSTLGLHPASLFCLFTVATENKVLWPENRYWRHKAFLSLQVLQACDLPAGLVSILTGRRDQLTAALANHSVIKAIWYWGSPEVRTERLYSRAGWSVLLCMHFYHSMMLRSVFVGKNNLIRAIQCFLIHRLLLKLRFWFVTFCCRAVSTSSTPAPVHWRPCACSARRTRRRLTGLIGPSWEKCGETLSSGRASGFLLHEEL